MLYLPEEEKLLGIDGTEEIRKGRPVTLDELYGIIATPNSRSEITKLKYGKTIFKTVTTIDQHGLRISTASHRPGKSKHLLLIDSSMVFGEGLNDDQTLSHIINLKSNKYEAYPIAFYGYGPQQAWVRFKQEKLSSQVLENKGQAIFFTSEWDIWRFFGSLNTLYHTGEFPFIDEVSKGNFVHRGNFKNSGLWWQKLLINYCIPFLFCANFTSKIERRYLDDNQYSIIGRFFEDVERLYRKEFNVESFKIIFTGNSDEAQRLAQHTNIDVIPYLVTNEDSYVDGHLKPEPVIKLADFLFNTKLID